MKAASGWLLLPLLWGKNTFLKMEKFNLQMQSATGQVKSIKRSKLSQISASRSEFVCAHMPHASCHPPGYPQSALPSQIIAGSFTIPNPKFQSTSNCLLFDKLNDRQAGQAAVPFVGHFEYGIEKRFPFESARVCSGLITFSSVPIMCECCQALCPRLRSKLA